MVDLEAVLADVSYLVALEKSKAASSNRCIKRIILADPSCRSIMQKHLEKCGELSFDKISAQQIGYRLFKEFCAQYGSDAVNLIKFYDSIKNFEKLVGNEDRVCSAKEIYNQFIMKELLQQSHTFSLESLEHVQELMIQAQKPGNCLPTNTFEPYLDEILHFLRGDLRDKFLASDKFTRFCQWKNLELNINLSMNDFSVHRILGRGGFGEVYGCRKMDTGKMYAMKCLDKKRIKLKAGENLAMNEKTILTLVSSGSGCPFLVCMAYAFQTTEKLCFVLDLMNGGDLHYHFSQHGAFSEKEVRFFAAEVILGLEHMHSKHVVYRDLKPANCLLDERGHIRISDLGLACDFGKKKPISTVGTYGYMAPEVVARGVAYDSTADWFSLGCMLYKLYRGRSPVRAAKGNERSHEISLNLDLGVGTGTSLEFASLVETLLKINVEHRLGCMGRGSSEVKEHPFFRALDWQQVYQQKYPPPLVPPRGEVNAADAFDIGNFDEEDVRGIKLNEADQELYTSFATTVSERWQAEVCETIFDLVNQEADQAERNKRRRHQKVCSSTSPSIGTMMDAVPASGEECGTAPLLHPDGSGGHSSTLSTSSNTPKTDCIVEGEVLKLGGPFMQTWQRKYLRLYPNRLEFYGRSSACYQHPQASPSVTSANIMATCITGNKGVELISMLDVKEINSEFVKMSKMEHCILLTLKNNVAIYLSSEDRVLISQWKTELLQAHRASTDLVAHMNRKAQQLYSGAEATDHKAIKHLFSSNVSLSSAAKGPHVHGDRLDNAPIPKSTTTALSIQNPSMHRSASSGGAFLSGRKLVGL